MCIFYYFVLQQHQYWTKWTCHSQYGGCDDEQFLLIRPPLLSHHQLSSDLLYFSLQRNPSYHINIVCWKIWNKVYRCIKCLPRLLSDDQPPEAEEMLHHLQCFSVQEAIKPVYCRYTGPCFSLPRPWHPVVNIGLQNELLNWFSKLTTKCLSYVSQVKK